MAKKTTTPDTDVSLGDEKKVIEQVANAPVEKPKAPVEKPEKELKPIQKGWVTVDKCQLEKVKGNTHYFTDVVEKVVRENIRLPLIHVKELNCHSENSGFEYVIKK